MSEAEEFLRRNPTQYCATIGKDGRPKVSPFRMMYCEGDDIYYCTGAKKAVYAELRANPYPEICACEGLRRLRISGKAERVDDRAAKEKAVSASGSVRSIYRGADDPDFKVFRIADASVVFSDLYRAVKDDAY